MGYSMIETKLLNNCYVSTFDFVKEEYENVKLKESDYSKCEEFKTGEFEYSNPKYLGIKIKRGKNIQRERGKYFKAKYAVS